MVINYPKDKISLDNGVLRIRAMDANNEFKSFSLVIPEGVRVNNTTYGLDIYGNDRDAVSQFVDRVQSQLKAMNG